MQIHPWVVIFWFALSLSAPVMASDDAQSLNHPEPAVGGVTQAIVQIGGRFCEYHRKDIELALRRHEAVQSIEFLNNHGTVLIRFEAGGVPPDQLAETAAEAAFGTGCRAWVDQGGRVSPRS
ncbi:MAG: exported protein of unknown function [Nitrospira sp.]